MGWLWIINSRDPLQPASRLPFGAVEREWLIEVVARGVCGRWMIELFCPTLFLVDLFAITTLAVQE